MGWIRQFADTERTAKVKCMKDSGRQPNFTLDYWSENGRAAAAAKLQHLRLESLNILDSKLDQVISTTILSSFLPGHEQKISVTCAGTVSWDVTMLMGMYNRLPLTLEEAPSADVLDEAMKGWVARKLHGEDIDADSIDKDKDWEELEKSCPGLAKTISFWIDADRNLYDIILNDFTATQMQFDYDFDTGLFHRLCEMKGKKVCKS